MPDIRHTPGNGLDNAAGCVQQPYQGVGAPQAENATTVDLDAIPHKVGSKAVDREASHSTLEIQAARTRCLVELRAKHQAAAHEYKEARVAWDAADSASKVHGRKLSTAHQDVYGRLMSEVYSAQRIINTLAGLTPQQYLDVREQALADGQRLLAQLEATRPAQTEIDINSIGKREHDLAYLIQQFEALL